MTLGIAAIALLVNLPFLTALLASFKTTAAINRDPLGLPLGLDLTFDHYANALFAAGYDFPKFFTNSTIIATVTVVVVLAISVPAAYAMVRLNLGGRRLLYAIAGLRLLPPIFFVLPLFAMFSAWRLIDTLWAMIIVSIFLNVPIAVVLLTRAIAELPIELEEAAQIDGASTPHLLRVVVLPLLAPSMVAAGIVTFLFTWNDYLFAVVMTTTNARTVTVGATNFITSAGVLWGDISAIAVMSVAIPMLIAVFAQRYLVSGLAAGALK
ncbi:carbohydrate ABC transporter permease [Agromyces binzhouensis]|uniref:carbohydrate ABC transporter permease n=1 Tax=Agromyces binzhouensis TaxID=1817495 RepID=UPI00363C39F3